MIPFPEPAKKNVLQKVNTNSWQSFNCKCIATHFKLNKIKCASYSQFGMFDFHLGFCNVIMATIHIQVLVLFLSLCKQVIFCLAMFLAELHWTESEEIKTEHNNKYNCHK